MDYFWRLTFRIPTRKTPEGLAMKLRRWRERVVLRPEPRAGEEGNSWFAITVGGVFVGRVHFSF